MKGGQQLKYGYKPTGCLVVDMVAACIDHYSKFSKKIAFIRLEKSRWTQFCAYVISQIPAYDFSDGEIDFDGVTITEGSTLQRTPLYVELVKDQILN